MGVKVTRLKKPFSFKSFGKNFFHCLTTGMHFTDFLLTLNLPLFMFYNYSIWDEGLFFSSPTTGPKNGLTGSSFFFRSRAFKSLGITSI